MPSAVCSGLTHPHLVTYCWCMPSKLQIRVPSDLDSREQHKHVNAFEHLHPRKCLRRNPYTHISDAHAPVHLGLCSNENSSLHNRFNLSCHHA